MSDSEKDVCPAFSVLNGKTFFPPELNDEYDLQVIAYETTNPRMDLIAPSSKREWIQKTGQPVDADGNPEGKPNGYGNRCLPLVAANSLGWQVLSDQRYEVTWNGGPSVSDVVVKCEEGNTDPKLNSHFGSGTVTWHLGYIFYTTIGNFLYCKGPTNHFKHGIQACEGLVETDWLPFTFTMNWMMTKPNETVVFEKGEPFCQLIPYPKEYAEHFNPTVRTLDSMPSELKKTYDYWCHSRKVFNEAARENNHWEGNYMRGTLHDETSCDDLGRKHFKTIKMRKFNIQSSNSVHSVE